MKARTCSGCTVALLTLICACMPAQREEFDVCDALRRAPELLGTPIKLTGWYGSVGYWSAIGSGECRDTLIEPEFKQDLTVEVPQHQDGNDLRDLWVKGIQPPIQFHGTFVGVLKKRTGHVQSGPVPLHAAPNLDRMPYVLEIQRVADVRFERATFFEEPPPPPER